MTFNRGRVRLAHAVMWTVVACILSIPQVSSAGPIEFGQAELDRALQARGMPRSNLTVEVRRGPAETWSIASKTITGGDERGLMYGLLEAADQIRRDGTLTTAAGSPATPLRGIRVFLHNHDLEEHWYYSREYWDEYFAITFFRSSRPPAVRSIYGPGRLPAA